MYVVIPPAGCVSRTADENSIASVVSLGVQALDQLTGEFAFVYDKELCSAQAGGRNTVATAVAEAILGEAPYEHIVFFGPVVVVGACNTLPRGSYAQLTVADSDTIMQYVLDALE